MKFEPILTEAKSKEELYESLLAQAGGLLDPECSWIANYANICALIQDTFRHWWCGFYFVNQKNQLELGPFQGPVACTLIGYNKGVCGTAWARQESIIVPDVHAFEGHIACSSESNSEIVIPVFQGGKVIGVLDIDSRNYNQFDETDRKYLEQLLEKMAGIRVKI